jgi:colanic acid/amylovoran biosynthesis glycosyltransferase
MTEEHPQRRVACLSHHLLGPFAEYVADQSRLMARYDPLILALCQGKGPGPLEARVRSLDRLSPFARVLNRLAYRLGWPYPYYEGEAKRAGCRLIHALSGPAGLSGLRLKSRLGLPLVTTFHGADASPAQRYERLFAEGDLFLADAEAVRRQLLSLGCPEERLRVHHPGVDLDRIRFAERRPDQDGVVNVLLVGRMVERKGIEYALQAYSHARRYHRRTSLTLIGDGPERRPVEALLRELSLTDVRLLGAQPREAVLSEMEKAHILLLPSITTPAGDCEGIPLALVEAQASGLPVVTTWHSGIPEVVADGRSGYLVSERDSHALAERLRNLIEHPEYWASFGRAGRAAVEAGFDLQRQVATLESYYDELLPAPEPA